MVPMSYIITTCMGMVLLLQVHSSKSRKLYYILYIVVNSHISSMAAILFDAPYAMRANSIAAIDEMCELTSK